MGDAAHNHPWKISDVVMFPLLAIGIALEVSYPTRPEGWLNIATIASGVFVIFLGFRLIDWSKASLDAADQPSLPGAPTTRLVTSNAFSFSRNPNYLGAILIALGITVFSQSLWFLALTVLGAVLLDRWMIAPEERYLAQVFGDEYTEYRAKVRRWI
jgi:protein-S-isoprenylcysteine O-methyltransferase Ste14